MCITMGVRGCGLCLCIWAGTNMFSTMGVRVCGLYLCMWAGTNMCSTMGVRVCGLYLCMWAGTNVHYYGSEGVWSVPLYVGRH